jgi:hypothetical protein
MRLYRQIKLVTNKKLEVRLYLFQSGRWELGLTFDTNGHPLFAINFIFIHLEFEFL